MRVYSPGDLLYVLRDAEQIVKAKNLTNQAKHEILTEIVRTVPDSMYCHGAQATRLHVLSAINEAIKLVNFVPDAAPVAVQHIDPAPGEPAGAGA